MKLSQEHLVKYNANRTNELRALPCWASVKSLYIGLRGKVMTCCYNKIYTLGEFPEQSLHEIWFGEKRKELTKALKDNNFSLGCQGCHELITAGNFGGLPAKNFDHLPNDIQGYPTKMDFELSNECNLECLMCRGEFSSAIRKNREKLPPIPSPYNEVFLKQLEEFIPHLKNCHFLGGEPFLIPIYLDIWELIHRINPSVQLSIQTNGTILTDRVKKILESMNFDISVSIDSADEDNYEKIRKNGKFKTVESNIKYLRDYCRRKNTLFTIACCPMTLNWQDLPEMVKFANELDAELFFTTVNYPKELALESLSFEELSNIEITLRNTHYSNSTLIEQKNQTNIYHVIEHIKYWKEMARDQAFTTGGSLDEYLDGLKQYVIDHTENADTLISNITTKLNYLIQVAAEHNNKEQAIEKITEINYKTIIETVPGIEKEHLLHLFQAYIIPIA
jgi:MoaA/NifB/PqqE/SkfB family radical SAM enzyme